MVVRLVDYEQNPQAASDAPRWRVRDDFSIALEPGFAPAVAAELAARGHRVSFESNSRGFGGAQLIARSADAYVAGSDHRKDGHAGGF
jgi:gamma-glutamyltranspeptidase/glutathione hydrolase